jgi:hypothetical protein
MSASPLPLPAVPTQEWNVRWIAILVATALIAGAAGFLAGGGPSGVVVVSGTAHSGLGQVSAQGPDDYWYDVPVKGINWTDSTGRVNCCERAACLPPAERQGPLRFAVAQYTLEGVTLRSVVWVYCRS